MLLSIEPDGPVPIYQQIRDQIVEAIADGQLPAGSGLPATRQLAVDLGINFHTVNKAYDLLRQEGLLRTLLAEATAQGLPADDIIRHCQAALAGFAFPAPPAEASATAVARS